jgi:hypothetical protein
MALEKRAPRRINRYVHLEYPDLFAVDPGPARHRTAPAIEFLIRRFEDRHVKSGAAGAAASRAAIACSPAEKRQWLPNAVHFRGPPSSRDHRRKRTPLDRLHVRVTHNGHDPFLFEFWTMARHFEPGKGMTFAPAGATGRVRPVPYLGWEFCGSDTNAMPSPAM